jgi:hypothetical protein
MNRFGGFATLVAVAAVTVGVAPLAGQAPADSAPKPPPTNHVETNLLGFKLSGYGEVSYVYSTNDNAGTVTGHLYDRFHDQFTLNGLKLVVEKPYATDKVDAGVRADLVFGQNATVLQSGGLNLGNQGDMTQLFVTLNLPTKNGNGFQLKAGKMVTLMGLEVIETPNNPNWSEGHQFIFVENYTALGLSAEYKFSKYVDAQLRLINGWDVAADNNTKKSFMGRVGFYPDDKTSIGVVGFIGPEQALTADATQANRGGIDVLVNRKFGAKTSVWAQFDWGQESANLALPDPTQDAKWLGLGLWVAYDASAKLNIAVRGDYINDEQGARSDGAFGLPAGTAHKFGSGTVTFNVKAWPNLLFRPELRFDSSNQQVYNGNQGQVVLSASAAYLF